MELGSGKFIKVRVNAVLHFFPWPAVGDALGSFGLSLWVCMMCTPRSKGWICHHWNIQDLTSIIPLLLWTQLCWQGTLLVQLWSFEQVVLVLEVAALFSYTYSVTGLETVGKTWEANTIVWERYKVNLLVLQSVLFVAVFSKKIFFTNLSLPLITSVLTVCIDKTNMVKLWTLTFKIAWMETGFSHIIFVLFASLSFFRENMLERIQMRY